MTANDWSFETKQTHAGYDLDPATGATALPIYQTSSYAFKDTAQAASRFALQELGPIYTRLTNPTTDGVAARIAALEGGVGGLLVSSGQSATALSILALAVAGNNVVASPSLYGGSVTLLKNTLGRLGIEARFVPNPLDPEAWRALAVPLIVDNTVATPYLVRPIEWGADIVVHSATKYLGGHGTSIAGAIVDSGNFDFASQPERFPLYNTPDESYHGLVYARDLGVGGALGANLAFLLRIQTLINRDLGAVTSPFNAFLISQGIETLSLRVERHVSNALAVAHFLEAHPDVESVNYAGLESSPYYELGKKYAPLGTGGLLSFVIKGGYEAGRAFADGVKLLPVVANIGDAKSLVIHPASTTHSQLTEEELAKAGVAPGTVRLSIGLENIKDILADLQLGFDAARAATA